MTATKTFAEIEALLRGWYGAPPKHEGITGSGIDNAAKTLGVDAPEAMRTFYERFGARADTSLVFRVENQGVTSWGVRLRDLGEADPPVVVADYENDGAWVEQSKTFSEFALAMTLFDLKWNERAALQANGPLADGRDVRALEERLEPAPVSPWIWPVRPSRLFTAAQGDVVVTMDGGGADVWLWLSARDDDAKAAALELVDGLAIDWASEPE